MAILWQVHPDIDIWTLLYTVPTDSKCTIQLFHVCATNISKPDETQAVKIWVFPDPKVLIWVWDFTTTYNVDDIVSHNQELYICIVDNDGNEPWRDDTYRIPCDQYVVMDWFEVWLSKIIDMFQEVQLRSWDSIMVMSRTGKATFTLFWKQEFDADSDIRVRAQEIAWWDFTHAKEYALLVWWAYQAQSQTQSCWAP